MPVPPAARSTHRGVGLKSWRLIARNLPFDTHEGELREKAEPHGHLLEVVLPKCRDPKYPQSCAGYAFLQFKTRKEAEGAKEAMNFSEFKGRKIALDYALDKDSWVAKEQEGWIYKLGDSLGI